ncbi:MAG: hypothetical protein V3W41_13235 [Planctomycetota bacterium]
MGAPAGQLAERLSAVVVSVRRDIAVNRDIFQDEVTYILRDPLTSQTLALAPDDYQVVAAIDGLRPLGDVFDDLVEQSEIKRDEEESFYRFILGLHQQGLLNLPISDEKTLYDRYKRKQRARLLQKVLGFLFLRLSIGSPDKILSHTMVAGRYFFSRGFLAIWAAGMAFSAWIIATRWSDLESPITAIVDSDNLLWTWGSLIALKLIHESGHGFACKLFGGSVPEIGVIFIVGSPCAYVDASAAWGFESKRERIIVSMAGMYFESIVAMAALAFWAFTPGSFANSMAYQVFILASVVTIGFNLNPLMRFDGYYIFADLLAVPNLRARAQDQMRRLFDRFILGLPQEKPRFRPLLRLVLASYGLGSIIYKFFLIIGLCTVIAMKAYYLGLALVTFYLASTLWQTTSTTIKHLFLSPDTKAARSRCVAVAILVFFGTPALLSLWPLGRTLRADGSTEMETESVIRVQQSGFLSELNVSAGQDLRPGDAIAKLENVDIEGLAREDFARLKVADYQFQSTQLSEPSLARADLARRNNLASIAKSSAERRDELRLKSPNAGVIVTVLNADDRGRFLRRGSEIATIGSGPLVARFFVEAEALAESAVTKGDRLQYRSFADPSRIRHGKVVAIAPAANRLIENQSLTQLGGGAIVVNPATGEADVSHFVLTMCLGHEDSEALMRGMRLKLELEGRPKPIAEHLYRRIVRFTDRIRTR